MKHQYEDYTKFVDDELLFLDNTLEERGWESIIGKNYRHSLLANKATLERHKGTSFLAAEIAEKENAILCNECFILRGEFAYFPCPSFLDVTNQLDEVMG